MLTMLLEEYELLFPETRRVRHQLAHLMQQIVLRYSVWLHDLYNLSKCEATIVALEGRLSTEDGDYSALLEDLRVHSKSSPCPVGPGGCRQHARDYAEAGAGSVTVPGVASAASVAVSRYAWGSTPTSFADSQSV